MFFTTSWDDGYKADLRIFSLLEKHGCKGTFYACPAAQHGQAMLSSEDIRLLSATMEVGAHSLRHRKLSTLPEDEARAEIQGSKQWVERLAGKPCTMFCYPKGDVSASVARLVQEAGYEGGRTVEVLTWEAPNRFLQPTTLQVFPFPLRRSFTAWHHYADPFGPARVLWTKLDALGVPYGRRSSWLDMAKEVFVRTMNQGKQFFHLWGHSAELDRYGLWEDLDAFLAFVTKHPVRHVTNGELTRLLSSPE